MEYMVETCESRRSGGTGEDQADETGRRGSSFLATHTHAMQAKRWPDIKRGWGVGDGGYRGDAVSDDGVLLMVWWLLACACLLLTFRRLGSRRLLSIHE